MFQIKLQPEGGVTKGEIFESVMADINNAELHYPGIRIKKYVDMNAPNLRWRDEIYDCFSNGFSHPMLWNSICCPQSKLLLLENLCVKFCYLAYHVSTEIIIVFLCAPLDSII